MSLAGRHVVTIKSVKLLMRKGRFDLQTRLYEAEHVSDK